MNLFANFHLSVVSFPKRLINLWGSAGFAQRVPGIRRILLPAGLWLGIASALYVYPNVVRYVSLVLVADRGADQEPAGQAGALLQQEIEEMDKKIAAKTPKSHYLVINTAANEFSLYKGTQLIKTDKCSTGSYTLLKNGDKQQWMFKTPKGEFRIRNKTRSPVWKKPDWAFVEEGLPIPSPNHSSRFEYGVLGDYSLSLGDGYLIHGTLFQRFIGLPVTHGCVRLNDENLELVFKSLPIGAKVYIY